jgi:sialate O-acetylesterase
VAEAWTSLEAISADAGLMPVFATRAHMMETQGEMTAILAKERREDQAAKQAGQPAPKHTWHPAPESWAPAALFNGMVAPVTPYTIKGVIWYQGESNSKLAFAPMYARLFPALIADWRAQWREGNFPFLFVQISSFTSDPTEAWAIIREAQRRSLSVENTAMAVTIDIGDPDNVHPPDKQTVGARLALAARALAYGESVEYSGPLFRQAAPEADGIRIWFDHAARGLVAKGGALQGFEIAGDDGRFATATARIDGETIVVSNPQVTDPKHVRYGWANAPAVNLFNSEGLPASPFTSEDAIPAP